MTNAVSAERCANCGEDLRGEFCSRCGQRARDLHQPVGTLLSQFFDDVFDLDTRLVRTVPLLFTRPGEVTRQYLAGRRAAFVTPFKAYIVAAFIFFGLFTLFPSNTAVFVFYEGSPEEAAARGEGGGRISLSLPRESKLGGEHYHRAAERAIANPKMFFSLVTGNIPRAFFVFLPLFALLLELFYRKQGYYVDHLVFSLYFHTFVFLTFSLFFLVGMTRSWLPEAITFPVRVALIFWPFVYLGIALRRVYGGSRTSTALKFVGLGVLYLPLLFVGFLALTVLALALF